MIIPEGILCSRTHEWINTTNNEYTIGLTDYGIKKLGDIIFIELPEAGSYFLKNEIVATIETVKAASEIYMPLEGKIIEINEKLINSPELINENPFETWLFKIEPKNFQEDSQFLMDYNDYIDIIQ